MVMLLYREDVLQKDILYAVYAKQQTGYGIFYQVQGILAFSRLSFMQKQEYP